jgi:hypothetical protein
MAETYSELFDARLADLRKMHTRFDRKYSSYSVKASSVQLSLAFLGVLTAFRDQITKFVPQDFQTIIAIGFFTVGALTTILTYASGHFKWAERRSVALELKIKCRALADDIAGDRAALGMDQVESDDLKPIWEKLKGSLKEIREISARNDIDPEDQDMSI